jgi:type IV secretion system protein VirB2
MKKTAKKVGQHPTLILMLLVAMLSFAIAGPAAAAGIEKVNKTVELFSTALQAIGIPLATIALMWGGYKMYYQGGSFSEIAPKFGGMVLAGAASTIAGYMMG